MGAERRETKSGKPKKCRLKDTVICSLAMLLLFFPYISSVSHSVAADLHLCVTPHTRGEGRSCLSLSLQLQTSGRPLGSGRIRTPQLCLIRQHLRLIVRAFLHPPTEINAEEPIW